MLNVEQLDVIEKVIDKYNNEDVIDSLSSHFRTNALNKAIPNLVFAKVTPIQNLSNVELICLVEGLFELTKLSIITPSKLFSKEELEEYDNLKQGTSNYTPSTIQRELDENDRKILRFLNETYGNYNTKHTYFFIYDTKIKSEEKENQKELALFTPVEVIAMFQTLKGSLTTKKNTLTFVTNYMKWYWQDSPDENPMLDIDDKSSLIIKNNKQISNQYVDIEELDEGLEELVDNPDNSIIPLDAFVAKAIRDGITVEQLANARYQDFDLVKNTVKIKTQKGLKLITVSEGTIYWLQESKNDERPLGKAKVVLNSVEGHVIKVSTDTYTQEQGIKSIRRRLAKFKEVGYRPLNENSLVMSKKIDLLDKVVAIKGVVTRDDFIEVQNKFGNSGSSWFKIRTEYEAIRGKAHISI